MYPKFSVGDLEDPVRDENRQPQWGRANLSILLEEKALIANLEHKNDTRVAFLYA